MKHILYILLISIVGINNVEAQLLANFGQTIYSKDNAIIKVEGSVLNDTQSTINHNGLIVIDSSFIQSNNASTEGFGEYQVFQDWDNSGIFIHDTSLVVLTGGLQNILGDSITDFYNLTLQGPGVKRQHINSETSNILDLRNNELATDSFEMFVSNNDVGAILYDNTYQAEGFVSSLDIGRLKRATNTANEYIYPLGSTVGTTRFRGVLISPTTTNQNNYAAILINNDASLDGFNLTQNDSSMCLLNNLFYHKVENTLGGDSATLKISYDLSQDGYWDGQADWNSLLWKANNPNNLNTPSNYNNVEKVNHLFNYAPIVLVTLKPIQPNLIGDSAVCSNNSIANYSVTGTGVYNWSAIGGTIINGQGTNAITVDWGTNPGGTITVSSTNSISGCSSNLTTFNTVLYPTPIAGITTTYPNPLLPNTIITLNDSSVGATVWNWDFNNGQFSNNQNTQTAYSNNGTYIIELVVENQFGCLDTTEIEIVVGGDILIPNVITPNGDGSNDFFSIIYDGSYNLVILNRWGQTLYEGNEASTFWDGTTLSGEATPDGTYFYVFKGENDFLKKGTLSLFR